MVVGGLQIKIRRLRCDGMAALEVGNEQLRWQNAPNEQDPVAKRKINCHRTVHDPPGPQSTEDPCPVQLKVARKLTVTVGLARLVWTSR